MHPIRQRFIVAEVSKNWPHDDATPIAKLYEMVIATNLKRGYVPVGHSLSQTRFGEDLVETIVATFENDGGNAWMCPKCGEFVLTDVPSTCPAAPAASTPSETRRAPGGQPEPGATEG